MVARMTRRELWLRQRALSPSGPTLGLVVVRGRETGVGPWLVVGFPCNAGQPRGHPAHRHGGPLDSEGQRWLLCKRRVDMRLLGTMVDEAIRL